MKPKRKAKRAVRRGESKRAKAARQSPPRRSGSRKFPAEQGLTAKTGGVGYGKPPAEHQFVPGRSGNPAGTPPARSNLWRHYCRFLEMSDAERAAVKKRRDLTAAERVALKQVEQLIKKGLAGTAWLATRESWCRDEGKPTEHIQYDRPEALTAEECEGIRRALKGQGT